MISVIIPALNEKDAIADTISGIKGTLDGAGLQPYEIIVVDDGSSDGTGDRARAAGAKTLTHPHNVGYGRSLKDGIAAACYDLICITDADGSYPIERIPELIEDYQCGFDMVVGARTGKHYRESIIKSPLRWILKQVVQYTASRKIPDINSGLRVFSRSTSTKYFSHVSDTFSFTTSLTLAYVMNNKFVKYRQIEYHERIGKSKVRLLRDSLRTIQYVLEAATYYNPMRMFVFFSMVCIIIAIISFVGGVLWQVTSAFFLGVGAILLAVLVCAMGLLAVLLKQIMNQT